jgi:hypothetical protein
VQKADRKPMSREEREREERYRFTHYRPPEPQQTKEKEDEPND